MEMTPRERVLASIDHVQTDRVPFSLGFGINLPAQKQLQTYLRFNDIRQVKSYLLSHSDIRTAAPLYKGPPGLNVKIRNGSSTDVWGIQRKPVSYGSGSYDEIYKYPLAEVTTQKDLDNYAWPSADWWDMDSLSDQITELQMDQEVAIQTGIANIFETAWYMRGLEQMFVDLIEEPELAWNIMKRVTDYYIDYYEKLLQKSSKAIDIVFTADDIGGQNGLLMSLDLWKRMIKPHHIRLNKALHQFDVKIMYHSDGAIMEAVPELIDMGIDILEALQFDAKGMDPRELKKSYGHKLSFHGGISVQKTLPFGNQDDVAREVIERIDVLGKQGGYILAPSHAVQAGTPPENIVALLETARAYKFTGE